MPIHRILITVIILLSYSLIFETNGLKNNYYVTPNETAQCSNDLTNCLTLEEYVNQPDDYFKNNTLFQFEPGSHTLKRGLIFTNLHNFTLRGKHSEVINVLLGPLVCITWENCSNIKVSSISFVILESFAISIVFQHSYLVQLYNISVYGNVEYVGCSYVWSRYSTIHIQDCKFTGIRGSRGAAMKISRSCVTFTGNNTFSDNSALYGGSLHISESLVTLSGINTFTNNTYTSPTDIFQINSRAQCMNEKHWLIMSSRSLGGAIYCSSSTLNINSDYSIFANNSVQSSGGAIYARGGNITIKGSVTFMKNFAYEYKGGAIRLISASLIVSGDISFMNNEANNGGALSIMGAKFLIVSEERMVNEIISTLNDATKFCRNVGLNGSIVEAEYVGAVDSNFNESGKGVVLFRGNVATSDGGGIQMAYDSHLILYDGSKICFENNQAINGGGMYLGDESRLLLSNQSEVSFVLNHAWSFGGALYVDDYNSKCSNLRIQKECFVSIYGYIMRESLLLFLNNSAGSMGSILYGGQLHECQLYIIADIRIGEFSRGTHNVFDESDSDALVIFKNISRISESESASSITSQSVKVLFCQFKDEKTSLRLDYNLLYLNAYPGEKFNISLVALDQTNSPVPTTVFIEKQYYYAQLVDEYRLSPSRQSTNGHFCTNLTYKLYSAYDDTEVHFKLDHENQCQNLNDGLNIEIFIKPCPLGLELAESQQCDCNKRLIRFTHKCSIGIKSSATIQREKNNFWISQIDLDILLIHEFRCPLDYCKDIFEDINLSDPSVQCDFNRTGIVCGQCRENFSLALGSLHCIPCNNKYTALILFFMMAGVALIAIIFLFQLTVSVGTLSGLFFYTNIIQANNQAYFPRATINFFTTFISWLNLDLGIETCFYDGMNIYTYSWLQFIFPFYVWFLVGCIIVACHYSQSVAKQLGKNPVAVLATLLLMFYSKILSAVIVPLTWTYLTYYTASESNETQSIVWMYDASIPYFGEPKHTALGLFAIFCIVIFVLPYISLLFFGHWLQGCSNWWILSWLNKIKPFMDAYHAPYRKHTRYWTGLLLISRLGLFLTFAINANGSESVNILAVSSVSIALLAIQRRVYQHWLKDALESSFLLNLGIFSVATFYLKEESEDDESQLILAFKYLCRDCFHNFPWNLTLSYQPSP